MNHVPPSAIRWQLQSEDRAVGRIDLVVYRIIA
jgi:hypothetical protein